MGPEQGGGAALPGRPGPAHLRGRGPGHQVDRSRQTRARAQQRQEGVRACVRVCVRVYVYVHALARLERQRNNANKVRQRSPLNPPSIPSSPAASSLLPPPHTQARTRTHTRCTSLSLLALSLVCMRLRRAVRLPPARSTNQAASPIRRTSQGTSTRPERKRITLSPSPPPPPSPLRLAGAAAVRAGRVGGSIQGAVRSDRSQRGRPGRDLRAGPP